MKLIVGLGNPGKHFLNTRHNVGFIVIDNYIKQKKLTYKEKFNGLYCETTIGDEKVIFLKPQNFMNLSGTVVRNFAEYFDININDILIIYDDMDFEAGKYKIKPDGSSGGHNGIGDIIENLGSDKIKRIRVGIGKTNADAKKYVLSRISKKDKKSLDIVVKLLGDVIEDFVKLDFIKLMNKYN